MIGLGVRMRGSLGLRSGQPRERSRQLGEWNVWLRQESAELRLRARDARIAAAVTRLTSRPHPPGHGDKRAGYRANLVEAAAAQLLLAEERAMLAGVATARLPLTDGAA